MGANGSALQFCYLRDFYRYVANSAHCHSKCTNCSGVTCCTLDLDTDMVSVTESEEEDAMRVCCL